MNEDFVDGDEEVVGIHLKMPLVFSRISRSKTTRPRTAVQGRRAEE